MRGEDHARPVGDLGQLVHEHRAAPFQVGDDVGVVHDLLAHVHRRPALVEDLLDDLDGPLHPGAERPRPGQQHPPRPGRGGPAGQHRAGGPQRPQRGQPAGHDPRAAAAAAPGCPTPRGARPPAGPRAAAASGADSRSAASAPPAASRCRLGPPASRSTVTTGPVVDRAARPGAVPRPAAAPTGHRTTRAAGVPDLGADDQVTGDQVVGEAAAHPGDGQRAELLTGQGGRLPPGPGRAVAGHPHRAAVRLARPAGRAQPAPDRHGLQPQRGAHHQGAVLAGGAVTPSPGGGRSRRPEPSPRAAARERGRAAAEPSPGAGDGRWTGARSRRPGRCGVPGRRPGRSGQVPAERADREDEPVQVVVEVEVTREPGAGELRLVPGPVASLVLGQPADPGVRGRPGATGREQREQRPRGLRRGGRAMARQGRVVVGAHVLAPAAVGVLMLLQPGHRAADGRLARLHPGGDQRGHHRAGAVDVVGAPPAEPGAVGSPAPAAARPRRAGPPGCRPGRTAASASTTCAVTSAEGGSVTAPKSQNGSLATSREVLSASKAAQPPSADAIPVIQVRPREMAALRRASGRCADGPAPGAARAPPRRCRRCRGSCRCRTRRPSRRVPGPAGAPASPPAR